MSYMIYALDYEDAFEKRKATRQTHIAYAQGSGKMDFAAPLSNEEGKMMGSIILLNVETREEAEEFVANDPYSKAGVFETVTIQKFIKP